MGKARENEKGNTRWNIERERMRRTVKAIVVKPIGRQSREKEGERRRGGGKGSKERREGREEEEKEKVHKDGELRKVRKGEY